MEDGLRKRGMDLDKRGQEIRELEERRAAEEEGKGMPIVGTRFLTHKLAQIRNKNPGFSVQKGLPDQSGNRRRQPPPETPCD